MAHTDIDPQTGEAFSLVEYTTPLAVNAKTTLVDAFGRRAPLEEAPGAATRAAAPGSKHISANDAGSTARRTRHAYGGGGARAATAAAQTGTFAPSADALKVLHAVLQPREWLDAAGPGGTLYSQHVLTSTYPTREDAVELEAMLDHELKARQARPAAAVAVAATAAKAASEAADGAPPEDVAATVVRHGCLCPVREALFSQVADELVRQVTLLEPTRGLLLARLRDHARMALAAYVSLAQGGVKYAEDKARQAASTAPADAALKAQLREAQADTQALRREVAQLQLLLTSTQAAHEAQRAARRAAHAAELSHLAAQNAIFTEFLAQAADADIDIGLAPAPVAGRR